MLQTQQQQQLTASHQIPHVSNIPTFKKLLFGSFASKPNNTTQSVTLASSSSGSCVLQENAAPNKINSLNSTNSMNSMPAPKTPQRFIPTMSGLKNRTNKITELESKEIVLADSYHSESLKGWFEAYLFLFLGVINQLLKFSSFFFYLH
jgi:hypothetical protein